MTLASRLLDGPYDVIYAAYWPALGHYGGMGNLGVTQFLTPALVFDPPEAHPHFPYGYGVLPD